MGRIMELLREAKMVLLVIGAIAAALLGGYEIAGEYFVTKSFAQGLRRDTSEQVRGLMVLSQQNTAMIMELRLLRYEGMIERGRKLSPTQTRIYGTLKSRLQSASVPAFALTGDAPPK